MTVKQLKDQLIGIPDDAVVLRPGHDHGYRMAMVDSVNVMRYPGPVACRGTVYAEDYGDEHNDPGGKRIPALVIS